MRDFFEEEVINGDTMVLETEEQDFKIVLNILTGDVIYLEFVDMHISKLNKLISHAKTRYQKYLVNKNIQGFME